MATKLIEICAPNREEEGADVVFVRKDGKHAIRIKAMFDRDMGGWSQWGADTGTLGDNVPAIEAWAEGMRTAYAAGDE